MSEALINLILVLCTTSVEPCIFHDKVILVPDYVPPHVHPDDLPSYHIEGYIIKPAHLGIRL
jgi:hypothetical protein